MEKSDVLHSSMSPPTTDYMEELKVVSISKTMAISACTSMSILYVAILYSPTLILRFPNPSTLNSLMIRRFICAAVSSVVSVFLCAFLLIPKWNLHNFSDEGIVFEICIRLPVKSIFRFRCVSKLWFSILSDLSFLTKRFSSLSPSPWSLFSNLSRPIQKSNSIICEAAPNLNSQFICNHGVKSLSFLYPKGKCPPDHGYIYVLATSNGLVLCSNYDYYLETGYFVCNPLTKKKLSLPRGPDRFYSGRPLLKYGFICESQSSSMLAHTSYKVVRVAERLWSSADKFHVSIFSSDLHHWNTYEVAVLEEVGWGLEANLVIHNGVVYWMTYESKMIAYDLCNNNTHQCRLIDLPDINIVHIMSDGCLGVSEGFLVYSTIEKEELSVWIFEEEKITGLCDWRLVSSVKLTDMLLAGKLRGKVPMDLDGLWKPVAINPDDGNVLILELYVSSLQGFFYYNIKTRLLQCLNSSKRTTGTKPLLLTPWPTTLHQPPTC